MKQLIKFLPFLAVLLIANCGNYLESAYTVVLPTVPEQWDALLGQPHWRVEWLDPSGKIQQKDILPDERLSINIPATWTNPVTAWPYWPKHNLNPGLFKLAGALFPHDASGGKLLLSWEAGADAAFYWELVYANGYDKSKLPANFDWLRFRELFKTGNINEEVRKDPWLVDWKSVAERVISSNFDSRRLVPAPSEPVSIPVGEGPWYGTSPFADPIHEAVFPVRSGVNVWVSEEGILKISGDTWKLSKFKE